MTFNQWCATKRLDRAARLALEAVWNAMVAAGMQPAKFAPLLTDFYEAFEEEYHDAF